MRVAACRRPLLGRPHRRARRARRHHCAPGRPATARTSTSPRSRRSGASPPASVATSGWEYAEHEPLGLAANAADTLLPVGIFPCADGYVSMMSTPQQLTRDARGDRRRGADAPRSPDPTRSPTRGPRRSSTPRCTRGCSSTPVPTQPRRPRPGSGRSPGCTRPAEVMEADHFHQRGFWVNVDDPVLGEVLLPGPPYRFDEGGWRLHHPAPAPPDRVARGAAAPRPARARAPRTPTSHRCAASASSTSPRCGRVRTSRSCSPTSAPR